MAKLNKIPKTYQKVELLGNFKPRSTEGNPLLAVRPFCLSVYVQIKLLF